MNRIATTLALAAGISCAAFGYEPQRHNETFTTNGITYAQRGGLGVSDYVVTNIDASTLAPAPSNYAAVSNAAMNAASRVNPTITNVITLVGYGNSHWELNGNQTGWYFTDTNGNTYRIELNSDSNNTSNDVGSASNVLLASRKWVYDRYLPKSGGTVTGALTVQENLTVGEGSATGVYSVAEGYGMAYGDYSHAEGHNTITTVFGIDAHAEGSSTTANGYASHSEGGFTTADNEYSHAEGESTTAQNVAEHAQGRFNASHKSSVTFGDAGNTLSSIGFGTADSSRTNAVETMQNGKTFIYGLGGYDGTNPTNGVKDLVAVIEGKADAADIPEWAKAPTKPTYTASEVGALGKTGEQTIVGESSDHPYFKIGFDATWPWLEFGEWNGAKRAYAPHNSGTLAVLTDIPPSVSNVVTKAYVENLGITLSETDPTVPQWAKADSKPSYTASEVGATSPTAVSNIVTTALVRERLGVYLYVGADGGIYVHTNED